jgi:hypothetical protein
MYVLRQLVCHNVHDSKLQYFICIASGLSTSYCNITEENSSKLCSFRKDEQSNVPMKKYSVKGVHFT